MTTSGHCPISCSWSDGAPIATASSTQTDARPALIHLDLRGGQFSRPTTYRLARTFEWLTRAYRIRRQDIDDHALTITPVPPRQEQEIVGERIPYIPDDWPDLRNHSFLWVPVAYDRDEESYAWQK
jgi:hypothetical protein